jgi:glucose/arabinose dehydrogenase
MMRCAGWCVVGALGVGSVSAGQDVVFLGAFGGHDYYLTSEAVTILQARTIAQDLATALDLEYNKDVYLTTINDEDENDFLEAQGASNWWIGLSDAADEGVYIWENGEPFDYENWAPGEPNNVGNEDYVVMWPAGNWNDESVTKSFAGIIEVNQSTHGAPPIDLVEAFPNLDFNIPVELKDPMDGTNRLFVVEKRGIISVFDNDEGATTKKAFVDLTDRFETGEEYGILGLAFHPNYADNGVVIVSYTLSDPSIVSVVSKFTVSKDDPDALDVDSEVVLVEVPQSIPNHNMHHVEFGPDGFLYIAVGDGGCCGDPLDTAQDLTDLRGSILRIDVDDEDPGLPYAIPEDNPFAGNGNGWREEIWAYGFRNPWRFSFDGEGRMWLGDVGQDKWEEVDWVVKGGNYGWPIMEGTHCYDPPKDCDQDGLVLPLWDHFHENSPAGSYAVVGGYVYEGSSCPGLVGKYIYADFVIGNVFAMTYDDQGATDVETIVPVPGMLISGFGVDASDELYIIEYSEGIGHIFKLECACKADVNGDGKLNVLDFVAFQGLWQAQDPAADCDDDGAFNILDFVCYQQVFVEGCP